MAKALENIRVLDFTRAYAGPFCTLLLKEFGAEVIKIEIPEGGDMTRGTPPFTAGMESNIFINLNRGKKSITLNLAVERGRQIALDLVKKVDVLVENFAMGVMDRLGFSYEALSKINPGLIYASSTGFGHTGPRRNEPSFDPIAQAWGGLMSTTGYPNSPPVKVGTSIADFLSGYHTAFAILAALQYRSRTGEGQAIDISMQDCVWLVTALEQSPIYFLDKKIPPKMGAGYYMFVPSNAYPTKDGYVMINPGTKWEGLLQTIGRDDLIGLEKYSTGSKRVNYRDEIDAMIEGWTKTRSSDEVLNALRSARVPCSPVPTFDQVANDQQLLSREMIIEVEQLTSGKVKVPGSTFKLSKTPGDLKFPSPFLGEHNYEIYHDLLGYSEREIKKLTDDGVI